MVLAGAALGADPAGSPPQVRRTLRAIATARDAHDAARSLLDELPGPHRSWLPDLAQVQLNRALARVNVLGLIALEPRELVAAHTELPLPNPALAPGDLLDTTSRPLISIARDGTRLTLPAAGESGGWIAKLPDGPFPGLAENELLMMLWAASSGIDVPAVDLVLAADVPPLFDTRLEPGASVYIVERFDRTADGQRVHIEDLAQVTGRFPIHRDHAGSYDAVGRLIRWRRAT